MAKTVKNQILTDDLLLINHSFNTYAIEFKKTLPHSHTFYEIFYIISGSLLHYYNGKKQILNPGDIVILRPEIDSHYFETTKQLPARHRDILISKNLFKKVCDFLSPNLFDSVNQNDLPIYASLSNEQLSYYERILSTIKLESYFATTCPPLYISILCMLLSEISESKLISEQKNYIWIDRLINILSTVQHFKEPLNELLKKHFYYEKSYMCKMFKKQTGMTMTQYFISMKLNYAKTLLASTDYSANKIADICGFNNLSYFHHSFKNAFGMTPLKFRKSVQIP